MRTTLTLNDDLMADAAIYSGTDDKSKIVNLALDHYIKWMAGRRLAALGGTMPDLVVPARNSRLADDFSPAREAARALAALGGTMPDLVVPDAPLDDDERHYSSKVAEDEATYSKPRTGDQP